MKKHSRAAAFNLTQYLVFFLAALLLAQTALLGVALASVSARTVSGAKMLNNGWTLNDMVEVQLPLTCKTKQPNLRLSRLVKEDLVGQTLSFVARQQTVRVTLEGQPLEVYLLSSEQPLGTELTNARVTFKLPQDSAGKVLTVELSSPYRFYAGRMTAMSWGTPETLMRSVVQEEIWSLLLCFTLLVLAVGMIAVAFFFSLRKVAESFAPAWLALEILLLGLFFLTQNELFWLVTEDSTFCSRLAAVCAWGLPGVCMIRVTGTQSGVLHRVGLVGTWLCVGTALLVVALQMMGVRFLSQNLWVVCLLCLLSLLYEVVCMLWQRTTLLTMLRALALLLFMPPLLIHGKLHPAFCAVLLLWAVCCSVAVVKKLYSRTVLLPQETEETLQAKSELRVAQINTHFFYHTISSTRALLFENPTAAYKMLGDLSRYLRYKTESPEMSSQLVRFSEEMKAVRAYIDIQQVLLGPRLKTTFEIACEDYYMPVLALQPLVENAVEHGIKPCEKGGELFLYAYDTPEVHVIEVRNSGAGLEQENASSDGEASFLRVSVSGENIRERLSFFPGCTLRLESAAEDGTLARLQIAKNLEPLSRDGG